MFEVSLATPRKTFFKTVNNVFRSAPESEQFTWKPLVGPIGNFIDRYVNLQGGGEALLELGKNSGFMGEFNSQKFIFTFEKVRRENLGGVDCDAFRGSVEEVIVDSLRQCSGDMQSSMSVLPSAVMQNGQSGCKSMLRVTDRFFCRIRLYSAKPILQPLRKWELVDTCVVELLLPHVDRRFQAVCVGGRFASLSNPNGFPYQSIESGAELIKNTLRVRETAIRHLEPP